MQIMEIDPTKKYVICLPADATPDQVKHITDAIASFEDDREHHMLFIYGEEVAMLLADLAVGYRSFSE